MPGARYNGQNSLLLAPSSPQGQVAVRLVAHRNFSQAGLSQQLPHRLLVGDCIVGHDTTTESGTR
jgi:hypothetical protein